MRRNNTQTLEVRHRQLLGLFSVTVILVILYLGFLGRVVTITVTRQESLRNIANLEPEIAKLESKYLALTSIIDLDLAKNMGFSLATDEIIFVSLEAESLALKRENNEI